VGESTTLCSHKRIGKARKQNIKASFKPIIGTRIYRLFKSTKNVEGRTVCYLSLALPLCSRYDLCPHVRSVVFVASARLTRAKTGICTQVCGQEEWDIHFIVDEREDG
jgi:hypothetical protein